MNEQIIWDFLYQKTGNPYSTSAIMGNLFAESSLNPKCRTGNTNLTVEEYTRSADKGLINFAKDNVAYGLVQWRYWSRKESLLAFARSCESSVGKLETQLNFMWQEIPKYKTVYNSIISAKDIREASDIFMLKYEKPGNVSDAAKEKRYLKGLEYYEKFTADDPKKIKMVLIAKGKVFLRKGNGMQYDKVARMENGVRLRWVATAENNWYAVEYNNQVLWCSGEYTEVV